MPLTTHLHCSSVEGLSSVTVLITGSKYCALIDPPFLIPDANDVVSWIRKTTTLPLKGVFVTHHHPDHYFSANPILEAFPEAKFYAAPYVCAAIDREYDEKVKYWPTVVGADKVPAAPRKPDKFHHSFFVLDGDESSPVMLLGPLQGDCVDGTLFWLPSERTIICGDAIYARCSHIWVEEIETPTILAAWRKTIALIEGLNPATIIPGHLEAGWELDAKADLEHNKKYLQMFEEKIEKATKKPGVEELFEIFKNAFPQAEKNTDFFLGHLSNQFGEGGVKWEENRHHLVATRTKEQLEAYWLA
ncbi:putative metallo-beta-lactamase domain protein [Ilyonectria destructans]|nr:putative metallo-beta-lactamase domain protein [Ilyonectria destructans]